MPRRSEVDRLKGDIDRMGFGPVRKDWSVEARAERRQRRNASKEVNMAKYRARRLAIGQPRRNLMSERRFLNGETDEANYKMSTLDQIQRMLDRYLPLLEQGQKFILNNGDRYFTLTNEKYIDITGWING